MVASKVAKRAVSLAGPKAAQKADEMAVMTVVD
jgi:hypothetical protein